MENVRLTANDAAESKVSIANLGYCDDPFAEAFLVRAGACLNVRLRRLVQ